MGVGKEGGCDSPADAKKLLGPDALGDLICTAPPIVFGITNAQVSQPAHLGKKLQGEKLFLLGLLHERSDFFFGKIPDRFLKNPLLIGEVKIHGFLRLSFYTYL